MAKKAEEIEALKVENEKMKRAIKSACEILRKAEIGYLEGTLFYDDVMDVFKSLKVPLKKYVSESQIKS